MSNCPLNLEAAQVACFNEALRQGPLLIERWCSDVGDVLNRRYTSSLQSIEKRHLQAAMLALKKHQVGIVKSFTAALINATANDTQTTPNRKTEKSHGLIASVSFDDMELMGDNQVQDAVDSARVLQTVALESEAGLAAFSARLSTAQGFAQVKTDKNPLRPEIFSQALLKAVQSAPVDNAIRSLWFMHGGALMGQQVQALYLALNELLIERGVAPAAYRVITNQESKSVGQANIELREQLKLEAKSLGQSLAVEVVNLMIEKMANAPRLLAPVQQIIANAEPASLRLTPIDPHFLSGNSHAVRSLLETIAAKSFAFASEGAPGFAEFLQDLQDVAGLLTEEDASDTQHFANLLAGFEKKVALRHAVAFENHRCKTQALLDAEQSNWLAKKISTEILARPDFVSGNRIIAAFLTGPWSRVLAKERLAVSSDKTGMYEAIFSLTLEELLWSLDVEQTASHSKRLAKLIPSILERLNAGLLSIDSPLADSKAFFEEMLTIHQSSLNSSGEPVVANATRATSARNGQTKLDLDGLFGAGDSAHSIMSWLSPLEGRHSSSAKDVALRAEPRFQRTQPFLDTAAGEKSSLGQHALPSSSIELRLGAWVELIADDQWLRAQLTWISLYNTLFMFTSAGGRTHSMTEPLLQYFLLQGLVRVISQEGVSAGSLDQVTRTAMHNTVIGDAQASHSLPVFSG